MCLVKGRALDCRDCGQLVRRDGGLWWGLAYGRRRFAYGDVCFAYDARLSAYGATSLSMGFATLSC